MTEPFDITAARDALAAQERRYPVGAGRGDGDQAAIDALSAALAEVERLRAQAPTPPSPQEVSDDEREALVGLIAAALDIQSGWINPSFSVKQAEWAVDAILAAGFRRQGPPTEAEIDAALDAWHKANRFMRSYRDGMRAALEAARAAVPTGEEKTDA